MVEIEPIDRDNPIAQTVAQWVHEEWGVAEGRTYDETFDRLFSHSDAPKTHVAIKQGVAAGVVSFTRFGHDKHIKPSLWMIVCL